MWYWNEETQEEPQSQEGKKREHGKMTWSKVGIQYFKNTQKTWSKAFVIGSFE